MHVYEYATIRLVPRVEREEFINLGVVLFCKRARFLDLRFHVRRARVRAFAPDVSWLEVESYLDAWQRIARAAPDGGLLATLDAPNRFRWMTNARSTILQCSPVRQGMTNDPAAMLERLFEMMVAE